MVEIKTRCGIPIWRTFRRIQWHVTVLSPQSYVSHCRVLQPGEFNGMSPQSHVSHHTVLPLGEFTVMIPEPYATLQGVRIPSAILKIVFRHILFFYCSLGFDERRLWYRLRYTCFNQYVKNCIKLT